MTHRRSLDYGHLKHASKSNHGKVKVTPKSFKCFKMNMI